MKRSSIKLLVLIFCIGFAFLNLSAQTNWTDCLENPVMTWGSRMSWDGAWIYLPFIIYHNDQYIMYYSGSQLDGNVYIDRMGRATSPDGLIWTKYDDPETTNPPYSESDPVLDLGPPGSWDAVSVYSGPVLVDTSGYKMWYNGDNELREGVGLATSSDGITWTKYEGNPVIESGSTGEWDDVITRGCIQYHESVYKWWYIGETDEGTGRVGYATSPDGITWTKHEGNPVFDIGDPGAWDEGGMWQCYVIFNGNSYEMWYESAGQTGYATSLDGLIWDRFEDNPVWYGDLGTVMRDGEVYRTWYYEGSFIGYAEDFSHIAHSDSININLVYTPPATDTLRINSWIVNPVEHSITVRGMMESDDLVLSDSTELTHQEGDLWVADWAVPEGERTYDVWVKTIDDESGIIHNGNLWSVSKFTTVGPVRFESYVGERAGFGKSQYHMSLFLHNEGNTTAAEGLSATLVPLFFDTCFSSIIVSTVNFEDLAVGETGESTAQYKIQLDFDCDDQVPLTFRLDIGMDGYVFWQDTVTVDVPSGLEKDEIDIPIEFALNQNYPNPFNPSTEIRYALAQSETVKIEVFNSLGQTIAVLLNKPMPVGYHEVTFNAENLSSGVYYYRIQAGTFQDVKKMVLIK